LIAGTQDIEPALVQGMMFRRQGAVLMPDKTEAFNRWLMEKNQRQREEKGNIKIIMVG
jgi:hypothetical protein